MSFFLTCYAFEVVAPSQIKGNYMPSGPDFGLVGVVVPSQIEGKYMAQS